MSCPNLSQVPSTQGKYFLSYVEWVGWRFLLTWTSKTALGVKKYCSLEMVVKGCSSGGYHVPSKESRVLICTKASLAMHPPPFPYLEAVLIQKPLILILVVSKGKMEMKGEVTWERQSNRNTILHHWFDIISSSNSLAWQVYTLLVLLR